MISAHLLNLHVQIRHLLVDEDGDAGAVASSTSKRWKLVTVFDGRDSTILWKAIWSWVRNSLISHRGTQYGQYGPAHHHLQQYSSSKTMAFIYNLLFTKSVPAHATVLNLALTGVNKPGKLRYFWTSHVIRSALPYIFGLNWYVPLYWHN